MNVAESCPAWLDAWNEHLVSLADHEMPDDEEAASVLFRAGWVAKSVEKAS